MNLKIMPDDIAGFVICLWIAVAYVLFIDRGGLPSDKRPLRKKPSMVLIDRMIFFLAFLIIPVLGFKVAGFELPGRAILATGLVAKWLVPVLALSVLAFGLGLYSKKGSAEMVNYPQYLPSSWNVKTLVLEISSWSMYLLAYEFAFRGILLHVLLPAGYWTAIAVQTGLYAFAHLPKSSKEAKGAIFFGILTSVMTLGWGTVLPAFFVHLALALGNDLGSLRAQSSGTR